MIRILQKGKWVERSRSKVLPELDVAWLLSFIAIEPQSKAVHALRDELRGGKLARPRRRRARS